MTTSAPDVDDLYPLSPLQQGMLLETLRRPGSGVYVQQFLCCIRGTFDAVAFEHAWREVVRRHAILRAGMVWGETPEPLHIIHHQPPLAFVTRDWREMPADARRAELDRAIADDRARGFDPADPPLMRFLLVRVASDEWRFLWTHHHLLLDGWSLGLVLQDVERAYDALATGQPLRLPERRPFREYVAWLRQQDRCAAEQFWRVRLHGLTEPTRLRYTPQPSPPRHPGAARARAELIVDESLRATLVELARTERLTLNVLLQGCWAILLSVYAGLDDLLFGITTSGRPPELVGADGMIGPFINTVPVRMRVEPARAFVDWMRAHQEDLVAQRPFEHAALVDIRRWSELPPDAPLFDTLFVFQNYPSARASTLRAVEILDAASYEQTDVPLVIVVHPSDRLVISLETTEPRWTQADLQRMASQLETVLRQVAAEPRMPLAAIEVRSQNEHARVVRRGGSPEISRGEHDLMAQFRRTVARAPDAPAIVVGTESWSFAWLQERASWVADHLRDRRIGADQVVAVCLDRSPSLIVAILGILDAGAAFLVLDPSLPPARRAFLLQDAAPAALILPDNESIAAMTSAASAAASSHEPAPIASPACPVIALESILDAARNTETRAERTMTRHSHAEADPASLAYVVYTSGSTGRPKGVMVSREGLANYVRWAVEAYAVPDEPGGAPWHGSLAFDLSFTSVFCPLLAGRPVVIVPEWEGPDGLARLLRARGSFGFIKVTPAHARALGDQLLDRELVHRARYLVVGGESLRAQDVERFRMPGGAIVVNEYGPTETVVGCSAAFVHPGDPVRDEIPIGDPISRMELLALDRHFRPVPVGVPGELYVGGVGVARGYRHRPDLTAERFVPHPYAMVPGERLYRTGDLVCRYADDSLVYLGRIDAQVKVSGYRIEPGEVEQALLSHPAVRQAVVIALPDAAHRSQLAAYVVLASEPASSDTPLRDGGSAATVLRAYLMGRLPEYLVPAAIVALDELPMAAGGKIDRARLAAAGPDALRTQSTGTRRVPPRDRAELELQRIWRHVLNRDDVGVRDRFFELGGDSLKAMHLAGQMRRHLGIDIAVAAVLEHATIESTAAHLRAAAHAEARPPTSLVAMRDGAAATPLVLVHPASGSITAYLDLLALVPSGRPVIGFQAQALDERALPQGTIEEIARRYVDELIASRWSAGPEIVGWSSGALVAFEMGVQLAERGCPVSRITLIDTPCPSVDGTDKVVADADAGLRNERAPDSRLLVASFARGLGIAPDALEQAAALDASDDLDAALDWVHEQACQVGTVPAGIDRRSVRTWFDVYAANVAAARRYHPRRYDGRVLVVIAEAGWSARSGTHGVDLGWSRCASSVETARVSGDHYSLLRPPHVQAVAAILQHETSRRTAAMECSS